MLTFASTSYADRYVPVYPPLSPAPSNGAAARRMPRWATIGGTDGPFPKKTFINLPPKKSNEEKLLYAQNI